MEFDWDNISIGDPGLNNSGSFFFRAIKSEKQMLDPSSIKMEQIDIKREQSPEPCSSLDLAESGRTETIRAQMKKAAQPKVRSEETYDRAYRYAQAYEQKRQALREKENKQLQEMKKFHARPAPNFRQTALKKENSEPKFTIPTTPKQMKPERLKKAAELAKKQQERTKDPEPAKFRAHDAKVLKEQPFRPELPKTVLPQAPFNLRMSARLQERKQFDAELQKAKEEKARREAEERRVAEERELKLLRKQKEFKANPNPFK
ncbi:calponin homology domain-containing protein DDB_G0272472-like [Wyeomyia smithii]|uniref:calponin homology domain-containing protein DDB_G0272472-like n=1 Tax=Wyeomyia smithii TaxID=174621 RepID=UPI002467C6D7|nr:calponin homology domain-containing protein DDB_G0272472-like [Wyeomyia smithii]